MKTPISPILIGQSIANAGSDHVTKKKMDYDSIIGWLRDSGRTPVAKLMSRYAPLKFAT